MSDLRKLIATDKDMEKEGVWINFTGDIELKIARTGNPRYKKEMDRVFAPYKKALRNQTMSDDVAERLMKKVYSKTIMVDWKNLELDGECVDYTVDKAYEIFGEFNDLYSFVKDASDTMSIYKKQEDDEAEKN